VRRLIERLYTVGSEIRGFVRPIEVRVNLYNAYAKEV